MALLVRLQVVAIVLGGDDFVLLLADDEVLSLRELELVDVGLAELHVGQLEAERVTVEDLANDAVGRELDLLLLERLLFRAYAVQDLRLNFKV